jgi:outer membrane protein
MHIGQILRLKYVNTILLHFIINMKMNKLKTIISLMSLCLLMQISINAQKIAVIDINAVLSELPEYISAQQEIDKIAADWNQDIAREFDKVKSMYNKYQAEQVLLSDEVRAQREDEIKQKEAQVRELQKRKFGSEGELFLKRREIVNPIQEKVFAAIETYALDMGVDLILDKAGSAGVLFVGEEFDKTDLIKRRLGIR